MSGTHLRLRHVVGAASLSCTLVLVAFSVLPVAAQTAPASSTVESCPVLSVGNPNPGDNIKAGGLVISGEAFDPASQSGAGISRVDLFLGERDQGGLFLGTAVPGANATDPRAWSVEVTVPSNFANNIDFAAYAISSVTGSETAVTFPIVVGTLPRPVGLITPTPVQTLTANVINNCKTTTAPATSANGAPAPAPPAATMAPAASAPVASTNACPTLSLANPNPGDTLTAGGLVISGTANGPSGVSRVDLFLGDRDQGGTFLGSGIPGTGAGGNPNAFSVEVQIPNLGRGVDFAAYAIGANGQEQVVTFPVFVGQPPMNNAGAATPTPVPVTQTITSTCK
jgi:Big-like domain-containing protein